MQKNLNYIHKGLAAVTTNSRRSARWRRNELRKPDNRANQLTETKA